MISSQSITLAPRTFALLEGLLQQLEPDQDILRVMLSRKLERARVVFAPDIAPDVATLNSRVRFRIDAGSADERILVWGDDREVYGATLPISVPRGLALLGMRVGQTVPAPTLDGTVEHLTLEAILFQPESARSPDPAEAGRAQAQRGTSQAVVTSLCAARERRGAAWGHYPESDDLGPGAA